MNFVFNTRVHTRLADTDTPISIYLKIRDQFPESILMESADRQALDHKYSYICCLPKASFIVAQGLIRQSFPDSTSCTITIDNPADVMEQLDQFRQRFSVNSGDAELYDTLGLFGYFNYDAVRYFESVLITAQADESRQTPDIQFSFYSCVIVFDHFRQVCHLIEFIPDGTAGEGIERMLAILDHRHIPHYPFKTTGTEQAYCSDKAYLDMVASGKAHCYAGDVFQVVLSRTFSQAYTGDDLNIYRALRQVNPSPYMFYFDYGSFRLMGASPEAQLKIRNNKASIHPIAGTYKRSGDALFDAAQAEALKEDPKENAEHVMLVDLARNDLSKNYRDVAVTVYKEIQFFSHVIHIVSEVEGADPVPGSSSLKVVADTFPAGTLSGAPKYKALQLIDQYEQDARGFYGGCIGFLGFNGDFNQAIMIRSLLSKDQMLYYRAGAGIVASSDPESELQEINNKLRAVRTALANAAKFNP